MTTQSCNHRPTVSFEVFPPKDMLAEETLWATLECLKVFEPSFVSVTCGARGVGYRHTNSTATLIQSEFNIPTIAHMTCLGVTRSQILTRAREYRVNGIKRIFALRGDGDEAAAALIDGYLSAEELVLAIQHVSRFEISVAAYPETHPKAISPEADIDNLKHKLDAGASRAITQFFFDPAVYERFLERVRKAGITQPIVPGIMPITNLDHMHGFAKQCGATIPQALMEKFDRLKGDANATREEAINVGLKLCQDLQAIGVNDFHFFTLNHAVVTEGICKGLLPIKNQA